MGRGLTVASGWHLLGGGVCNFYGLMGGGCGMDGVRVAGLARFFGCVGGQNGFLVLLLIFVCEFLVDGTGMVMILLMLERSIPAMIFPSTGAPLSIHWHC